MDRPAGAQPTVSRRPRALTHLDEDRTSLWHLDGHTINISAVQLAARQPKRVRPQPQRSHALILGGRADAQHDRMAVRGRRDDCSPQGLHARGRE